MAPPHFNHVLVRGAAELCTNAADRRPACDAIDYDLTQFGATEPDDPNLLPVRSTQRRVVLSEMFGSSQKRVWRA